MHTILRISLYGVIYIMRHLVFRSTITMVPGPSRWLLDGSSGRYWRFASLGAILYFIISTDFRNFKGDLGPECPRIGRLSILEEQPVIIGDIKMRIGVHHIALDYALEPAHKAHPDPLRRHLQDHPLKILPLLHIHKQHLDQHLHQHICTLPQNHIAFVCDVFDGEAEAQWAHF